MQPGAIMSVEQCWALAQRWYRGRAERDWTRPGPSQMRAIFDEVGLTSRFWSVD